MSKPVLFASFRPLERAENIHAIYDAYKGEKAHILSTDPRYAWEVISGKYGLLVTDDFPDITPGKCIMVWHGIQGGKYIGLDQPGSPHYRRSMAQNMDYIISAGTGAIPMWHTATGVDEQRILPYGLPRTDKYVEYKELKHEKNKKRTYLFAPTFRDRGETPFPRIDWEYLDRILTDDEVFVVKAHPWQVYQHATEQVTPGVSNGTFNHIVIVSPATPTTPFLYGSDVIITDYSSIMFDAYLLDKPVVLFEKLPGYVSTRGMYLDYPSQYCSRYASNEAEMVFLARKADGLTDTEHKCRNIVADACDGHACERIINLINTMKGG